MPLVYLPAAEALFLWGEPRAAAGPLASAASEAWHAELVTPAGRERVSGRRYELIEAVAHLGRARSELASSGSTYAWTLAAKLALELVARERVLPALVRTEDAAEARWAVALSDEDAARASAVAAALPPAGHAVPLDAERESRLVWAAGPLVRAFLDAAVDALVRAAARTTMEPAPAAVTTAPGAPPLHAPWHERWRAALLGPTRTLSTQGFGERTVFAELERWSMPALGARGRARLCLRLEAPGEEGQPFTLRLLLRAPDDPSLLVPAAELWSAPPDELVLLGPAFRDAQETLLASLARAARLFPALATVLASARPETLELDAAGAFQLLDSAAALAEAGFGVIVPAELTSSGRRRLRLRLRVGGKQRGSSGRVSGSGGLGLDELVEVDWEALLGDEALTLAELEGLAARKAPLVRFRGAWAVLEPAELGEARRLLGESPRRLAVRETLPALLSQETTQGERSVAVAATGAAAALLAELTRPASEELTPPPALRATLRPYQLRGLAWLAHLSELGFGACLADDMGLGKTLQLIALLLRRAEHAPATAGPVLLVTPTSVLGNWERELTRFAPTLRPHRHYGPARFASAAAFPSGADALVLTTYGLLRRDRALLAGVKFSAVVLDEAQHVKNPAAATARAARSLAAPLRIALTGTPLENRLAELWSILEFANPGLLGPLERFRRDYAVPIERYADAAKAERLRRLVGPFVLRRQKSDPLVIRDLPAKLEAKIVCTLTREQATLYRAAVDEELRRIGDASGAERRGRVLALLAFTKQICDHPALYLGEHGPLAERSGKLTRVTEMLEEVLAAGDKALVFTQYFEMGTRLVAHFRAELGEQALFLHGRTARRSRDELVERFQTDPSARVFVLSLKAGGTGLNLTAASHVFHYDRWWNPAVEDQATDRAYRIGQTRTVQVHKLVAAGTVEDKIDRLLEQKRALAGTVLGTGERWLTELDTAELVELFQLAPDAATADDVETPIAPGARSEVSA